MDLEEFIESLGPPGPFKSGGWYSPEGKTIHIFIEGSDHYAQWINHWLTLYRAFDDDRIVGLEYYAPLGDEYIDYTEEQADLATAPAWKADERNSLGGSNPSSSAIRSPDEH